MTTITLEIPAVEESKVMEYKKIFTSFAREYSLKKLKEINSDTSPIYGSWEVLGTEDHENFLEILRKA